MTKPPKSSTEWETPQWLFDKLDAEFHFLLDAAANEHNHKCKNWIGETHFATGEGAGINLDGTSLCWNWSLEGGAVFLNPPYDKIEPWVRKALMESMRGATVVCVLPAKTDTNWWHEYVKDRAEIRFLRGRVHFEYEGTVPENSRPVGGTAIVIYRGLERPFEVSDDA